MGFKSPQLVIFNFYAQTMPRKIFVGTIYIHTRVLCLAIETKHFHSCWYFSTSQWVCSGNYFIWVVAIFVSGGWCRPLWAHPWYGQQYAARRCFRWFVIHCSCFPVVYHIMLFIWWWLYLCALTNVGLSMKTKPWSLYSNRCNICNVSGNTHYYLWWIMLTYTI